MIATEATIIITDNATTFSGRWSIRCFHGPKRTSITNICQLVSAILMFWRDRLTSDRRRMTKQTNQPLISLRARVNLSSVRFDLRYVCLSVSLSLCVNVSFGGDGGSSSSGTSILSLCESVVESVCLIVGQLSF